MKLATILVMIFALVIAIPAMADDVKIPNASGTSGARVDCDVAGCDYYGEDTNTEFDATGGPLVFGPIATGGGTITNVVLSLNITQTWVGDLNAHLYYDADGDGTYDAGPVLALARPNLDGYAWDGCCGCSGDISGIYTFGDDGAAPLGDPDCPSAIDPGCYMAAPESPMGFAATFSGLAGGGDFYLEMGDGAGGDITYLHGWGVYVCVDATATESSAFSSIKSLY